VILECIHDLATAEMRARDVAAHRDQVLALGVAFQHRVEARRAEDLRRSQAEDVRDLAHAVVGDVTLDRLHQEHQRE
jgi:hypothetical protein